MVANRKVTGRAMGMPAGILVGGAVAYGMSLVLAAVMGGLLIGEHLALENVGYAAMIILMLSSALGAVVAQGLVKHRKLTVCLASGGAYYLMLLGTTALFFGGQYQGVWVTLGVVLAGAGSVGLFVTNKRKMITKGYRISQTG